MQSMGFFFFMDPTVGILWIVPCVALLYCRNAIQPGRQKTERRKAPSPVGEGVGGEAVSWEFSSFLGPVSQEKGLFFIKQGMFSTKTISAIANSQSATAKSMSASAKSGSAIPNS